VVRRGSGVGGRRGERRAKRGKKVASMGGVSVQRKR